MTASFGIFEMIIIYCNNLPISIDKSYILWYYNNKQIYYNTKVYMEEVYTLLEKLTLKWFVLCSNKTSLIILLY